MTRYVPLRPDPCRVPHWPAPPDPKLDDAHFLAATGVWARDAERFHRELATCPWVVER